MATQFVFRKLLPDEFQDAYAIVCQTSDWLKSKGYQHWLVPAQAYRQRHAAGENYGLWMSGLLVAVVSLGRGGPRAWQEYLPSTEFVWLGTLSTAIEFKGRNLGMLTLNKAEALLRQQGVNDVYLDCYYDTGFLPRYYESAGYEWVARKGLVFADGSVHDSVLMYKELRSGGIKMNVEETIKADLSVANAYEYMAFLVEKVGEIAKGLGSEEGPRHLPVGPCHRNIVCQPGFVGVFMGDVAPRLVPDMDVALSGDGFQNSRFAGTVLTHEKGDRLV